MVPITCDAGRTRDLKATLDREQRNLDTHKDKRRDLEAKQSRATDEAEKAKWKTEIESVDKDIESTKKKIDDLKGELEKRRDLLARTITTLGKCIDYRRAVMNVFAYATDKVRGESEPDIKPYAQTLRDKYPVAIAGDQEAIENTSNALQTCTKELP